MRVILRKLQQRKPLDEAEYTALIDYAEYLCWHDHQSYALFYDLYADFLHQDYHTYLPRFRYGRDDFYDYLLQRPELIHNLQNHSLPVESFPEYLHEYLFYAYGKLITKASMQSFLALVPVENNIGLALPAPRQKNAVYKYEDGNPYKEPGLKAHFEKIGRYTFVSRLQSYRYLRGNKSATDKIEVLSPDCLGGIFSNKEKSIYYYIFLTEADNQKASNACQILNTSFYGK